jgi:hypothetical protein
MTINLKPHDAAPTTGSGLRPAIWNPVRWSIAYRLAAALLGGYAFTRGLVALGVAGLVALGWEFHEAETAMLLLAFLLFLPVFLWAFAAASLARVWIVLLGGAGVMTAAARGLQWVLMV